MSKLAIGVLASGRGSNLAAIMAAIDRGEIAGQIKVVISDHGQAPALERARRAGIKALPILRAQYESKRQFEAALAAALQEAKVELVVLAGFMRLLSADFVAQFPGRIMNIHPALLPSFPGLEAQRQAVDYGVRVSGCTVHFVDQGMDSGPVILQATVPVLPTDSPEELAARILVQEHRLYPEAVSLYAAGRLSIRGRKVIIQEEEKNES